MPGPFSLAQYALSFCLRRGVRYARFWAQIKNHNAAKIQLKRPQKPDENMMSKVEDKLNKIGVTIPDAPTPAANYLPFNQTGNLVFVSGQVPFVGGKLQIPALLALMQVLKTPKAKPVFAPLTCWPSLKWRAAAIWTGLKKS